MMILSSLRGISTPSSLTKDAIPGTGLPLNLTTTVMMPFSSIVAEDGIGTGTSNPTQGNEDKMHDKYLHLMSHKVYLWNTAHNSLAENCVHVN